MMAIGRTILRLDDEESSAMIPAEGTTTKKGSANSSSPSSSSSFISSALEKRYVIPIFVVSVIAAAFTLAGQGGAVEPIDKATFSDNSDAAAIFAPNAVSGGSEGDTDKDAKNVRRGARIESMKEGFRDAKEALLERLEGDYGHETFQKLFLLEKEQVSPSSGSSRNMTTATTRPTRGRTFIQSVNDDDNGWKRMKRKLKIKILTVLTTAEAAASTTVTTAATLKFVWATGGHSAAAGHGNFFNQSYTAQMERQLLPVFRAADLDFVGRNYAVGGQSSAPEIASCVESMFG